MSGMTYSSAVAARTDELPSVLLDVVEIDGVSGERVTVPRSIDTPPAKLERLIVRQVPVVSLVEDTVGKGATRTHREEIAFEPCTIRVYVEDSRALCTRVCQCDVVDHEGCQWGVPFCPSHRSWCPESNCRHTRPEQKMNTRGPTMLRPIPL